MKKAYETPSIEKVAFQYRDQVVVASGAAGRCYADWANDSSNSTSGCFTGYHGDLTGHN